ncbi:hypothetical protein, partial [Staphylococcus aureus]|uniref:hypothetical protein n=1 Tax=Staphylococcus aureus TaxID=1280 RepID=UPI0038B39A20
MNEKATRAVRIGMGNPMPPPISQWCVFTRAREAGLKKTTASRTAISMKIAQAPPNITHHSSATLRLAGPAGASV